MLNWRERYNKSQAIQADDTNTSTERIRRLVNIYKNDLIEQDLQQYAQRLSDFARCCQICVPKSYTLYKWSDTSLCAEKDLLDLRLSGRSVSSVVYYWKKTLIELSDDRGQLTDFEQHREDNLSISSLSSIDETISVNKGSSMSFLWKFIHRWIMRFQMYYTYRQAQLRSPSFKVHTQPLKSFRSLFQSKVSPIFICFVDEEIQCRHLFWTFRHLVTVVNWPATTKIFSNRPYPAASIFERTMATRLGFIDLSPLNLNRTDLFSYLYRCLKTCEQNGPLVFLFDSSTKFQPSSWDYHLICFLVDFVRFDASGADLLFIPTCFQHSSLSFSQPFLFKEFVDNLLKRWNVKNPNSQWINSQEADLVYKMIDVLFLHLAYDAKQLTAATMQASHLMAAIDHCQILTDEPRTTEIVFHIYQSLQKTCSLINAEHACWNGITEEDIEQYYHSPLAFKSKLMSEMREKYFLETIAALSILSKMNRHAVTSRLLESDFAHQLAFLLCIFATKESLAVRPCQTIEQTIQRIAQVCQSRNYFLVEQRTPESTYYRDTLLSDGEWSDDDENDEIHLIDDEMDDHHDLHLNDHLPPIPQTIKPFYRVNYPDNHLQLQFFARFFGAHLEAMLHVVDDHIQRNARTFHMETLGDHHSFRFQETTTNIAEPILQSLRRAYAYQTIRPVDHCKMLSSFVEPTDDDIYPLQIDHLSSVRDQLAHLLMCCFD